MAAIDLPPGQQLAAANKWPLVGERAPGVVDGPWTVRVHGEVERPLVLSLDELLKLSNERRAIDIHCVTRWSKPAMAFSGVLLSDLLNRAGIKPNARFVSFVAHSARRHDTSLALEEALRLETLIATGVDGGPLPVEHGGPVRVVVPGRYFYKSLKWLAEIELLAEDRLGYWEAHAGYHNHADPWRQERFIAAEIDRRLAAEIVATRNVAGRELLGLDLSGCELVEFNARRAVLRNSRFERSQLARADFGGANLSGACFRNADLREAKFENADAEGADFAGANLGGVDFRGASLIGATFADFDGTNALAAMLDTHTIFSSSVCDDLMPQQWEWLRRYPEFRGVDGV